LGRQSRSAFIFQGIRCLFPCSAYFDTAQNGTSIDSKIMVEMEHMVMTERVSSAETEVARLMRRRRRARLARFIVLETLAIALTAASVLGGLMERFVSESLTKIFEVLPVTFAVVAVVLPIVFFGHPRHRGPRL
jgi:hypothetical protein